MAPPSHDDDRALDGLASHLGAVAGLDLSGSQRLRLSLAVRERARELGGTFSEYAARVRGDGPRESAGRRSVP